MWPKYLILLVNLSYCTCLLCIHLWVYYKLAMACIHAELLYKKSDTERQTLSIFKFAMEGIMHIYACMACFMLTGNALL